MQPRSAQTALLVLALLAGVHGSAVVAPNGREPFTARFLHTNDMHARFDETSIYSSLCNDKDKELNKCVGGFARIATLLRQARKEGKETGTPTFFLNAGDTYQGSRLFQHYKYKIALRFLNILRPDVVSLGNHEFDGGIKGLVPFLQNVTFPVIAANVDLSGEPELENMPTLHKSVVFEAKGHKIGVVGYITPDTKVLSHPGNVKFLPEVPAIREEARRLKKNGCDIIISLGHSGYDTDKRIAREVEEMDLVIGGHTNTFLYTGPKPSSEEIEGLYPTVVEQKSGRKVYVVQAYAYTKYFGDLTVDFDANGEITNIKGNPVLVDGSVPKAPDVDEEVQKWLAPIVQDKTVVGVTKVLLQGDDKICRLDECNFGNFVTDAMVYYYAKSVDPRNGWTDAPIALHQSGGIRSSIGSEGTVEVTNDDVNTAFPFESNMFKVKITGEKLLDALEWSVHDRLTINSTVHGGAFLQMSGIRVIYNVDNPVNQRVVSVRTRCGLCNIPTYQDLVKDKEYTILITDFMYNGGDGFKLKGLPVTDTKGNLAQIVMQYLNETSPVYPGIEDRITYLSGNKVVRNSAIVRNLSALAALISSSSVVLIHV